MRGLNSFEDWDAYFQTAKEGLGEHQRILSETQREHIEMEIEYRWAMTDDIPGAGSIDDFG